MQGVASSVVMPHKTTETKGSVGPASSTEAKVGTDEKSHSQPNPAEAKGVEGHLLSVYCYLKILQLIKIF